MPSIKIFKDTHSDNQNSSSSLGLWDMLDEFKKMVPATTIVENSLKETLPIVDDNNLATKQVSERYSNRSQTGLKTELKRYSNGTQTGLKNQLKKSNGTQTVLKQDSERYSKQISNGTQTVLKQDSEQYSTTRLNELGGKQRKLLFYIYTLCKTNGTKITPPLCRETICENTVIKKGTIKTALNRLIKKHFLLIDKSKTGRSGWIIFRIPDPIYQELFNNDVSLALNQTVLKQISNSTQTGLKQDSERYSERYSNAPIVSSNINTTTTYIPESLRQIDYSPLSEIGFDEAHIIQIYREHTKSPELALSTDIIQNSIYALAFDLKHNNVAENFKCSPAVVLTAMLKKGQPYSSKTPEKVLTPREEAMQEYIIAQEKRDRKIQELENKTKEFELQEWLKSLPEQELATFASQDCCPEGMPEKVYQTSRRKKALAAAQEYFITVLWPQKLNELETLKQTPKLEKDVI
jgi:DNA-binding MarR family transcriptional regulator